MEMTTTEKIKLLKDRCGLNLGELAEKAGTTRQNLNNKFGRNNFCEKEIRELGDGFKECHDLRFEILCQVNSVVDQHILELFKLFGIIFFYKLISV